MGNDAWKLKCMEVAKEGNELGKLYVEEILAGEPVRNFEKWNPTEDENLRHNLSEAIKKLAELHKRKPSAIMFRIVKQLNEVGIKLG